MMQIVWLILGVVMAIPFLFLARSHGIQREPAILALGLIGAAVIYIGFAIAWGNALWFAIEVGGLLIYSLFVWLAWRYTMVWLAVGWIVHPLWDGLLHWIGQGHTIAPAWYVIACLSFDLLVAGYILTRIYGWQAAPLRVRFGRI